MSDNGQQEQAIEVAKAMGAAMLRGEPGTVTLREREGQPESVGLHVHARGTGEDFWVLGGIDDFAAQDIELVVTTCGRLHPLGHEPSRVFQLTTLPSPLARLGAGEYALPAGRVLFG